VKTNLVIACVAPAVFAACATNPATGKPVLSLVSNDQEIALGEQAVQDVKASIGLIDDARLQGYVSRIGKEMAAHSERPQLPWSFAVVDDPSVNAFALPGGKIFVTRGLCAHVDNEAQLATVIGHEIGHVTARHTVQRMSQQELIGLGLGLGMVISDKTQALMPLANAGLSVLFLKFSRDDEYQADELGVRYASRVNYDVRQMPAVFRMLEQVSQQDSGGRLPEWLSTHPEPEHRIERIEDNVRTAINNAGELRVGRDTYLKQLEGLVYGQDPREGFVRGGRFYHPGLRFSIDVPENWKTQNTREALIMASPDQDALIQLSAAPAQDPEQALSALSRQQGVQLGRRVPDVVSGLRSASAEIAVTTQDQGALSGLITFVILGGHTFQLLGLAPQDGGKDRVAEFARVQGTFKPVSDRSVLGVEPARIHVIDVPDDTTLPVLYGRQPASISLERVAMLNQMKQDGGLKRGELVKWVVGGSIPEEDGASEQ